MKMTVVIELELNDVDIRTVTVESIFAAFVQRSPTFHEMDVTHIEAARGDMYSTFGISGNADDLDI